MSERMNKIVRFRLTASTANNSGAAIKKIPITQPISVWLSTKNQQQQRHMFLKKKIVWIISALIHLRIFVHYHWMFSLLRKCFNIFMYMKTLFLKLYIKYLLFSWCVWMDARRDIEQFFFRCHNRPPLITCVYISALFFISTTYKTMPKLAITCI